MRPLEEILRELTERGLNPNIVALVESELRASKPDPQEGRIRLSSQISAMNVRRDKDDLRKTLDEDENRPAYSRCIRYFNEEHGGLPPSKVDMTIEMLEGAMKPWFDARGWKLPHADIIEEAAGRRSPRPKTPQSGS